MCVARRRAHEHQVHNASARTRQRDARERAYSSQYSGATKGWNDMGKGMVKDHSARKARQQKKSEAAKKRGEARGGVQPHEPKMGTGHRKGERKVARLLTSHGGGRARPPAAVACPSLCFSCCLAFFSCCPRFLGAAGVHAPRAFLRWRSAIITHSQERCRNQILPLSDPLFPHPQVSSRSVTGNSRAEQAGRP